jgi:hypothetical protein
MGFLDHKVELSGKWATKNSRCLHTRVFVHAASPAAASQLPAPGSFPAGARRRKQLPLSKMTVPGCSERCILDIASLFSLGKAFFHRSESEL